MKKNDLDKNVPSEIRGMLEPKEEKPSDPSLRGLLDQLNGESEKMTAALQNPNNWPGIMKAAEEARDYIAGEESRLGLTRPIGTVGPVEAVPEPCADRSGWHNNMQCPHYGHPKGSEPEIAVSTIMKPTVHVTTKPIPRVEEPVAGQPYHMSDDARMRVEDAEFTNLGPAKLLDEAQSQWPDDRGTLIARLKRAGRRLLRAFRG